MSSLHPLRRLAAHYRLTDAQLAERLHITPSSLSQAINGYDTIRPAHLRPVFEAFPEVSAEWILSGTGPIFKHEYLIQQLEAHNIKDKLLTGVREEVEQALQSLPMLQDMITELMELRDLRERIFEPTTWLKRKTATR